MANDVYTSAGLIPVDNATRDTANTVYISAGLIPNDVSAGGGWGGKIAGQAPAAVGGVPVADVVNIDGV